jgi:beta-galactosidase
VLRAAPGVEATRRRKGGDSFLFVLNHNEEPARIDLGARKVTDLLEKKTVGGTVTLPAKGVMVLKE